MLRRDGERVASREVGQGGCLRRSSSPGSANRLVTWILLVVAVVLVPACREGRGLEPAAPPRPDPSQTNALFATETAVPSPSSKPIPPTATEWTCAEPHGKILEEGYPGLLVAGEVPYNLYLPPCYQQASVLWPVLYLFHGYPYDQDHWLSLGVVQVLDRGIVEKDWPGFMVVMPMLPEPLYRGTDGGPGSYEQEFLEGLVPHIERRYEVISDGSGKALGGISRGGVWSLEIGFRHPNTFDLLLVFSPALAVNYARDPYDPYDIAATGDPLPRGVFLLAGETDWALPAVEKLAGELEDRPLDLRVEVVPGGHDASTWEKGLLPALEYLSEVWRVRPLRDSHTEGEDFVYNGARTEGH